MPYFANDKAFLFLGIGEWYWESNRQERYLVYPIYSDSSFGIASELTPFY